MLHFAFPLVLRAQARDPIGVGHRLQLLERPGSGTE
jgi:hypothetical protein